MPLRNGEPARTPIASLFPNWRSSGKAALLMAGLLLGSAGTALAQSAPAADADLIAKGRYLATAADCAACHTAPHGGVPFAGGYGIDSPLGKIVSTNITPSKANGIGSYSEADFARAVRDGVAKDGTHLYPAMPYTAYAKMSDADLKAIYAYLMHEVKPAESTPPKTALPFPFSIRASMAVWNLLFLDTTPFKPDPSKPADWNRGAYLAEALAHCSTCHTPRNLFMAEDHGQSLGGGSLGAWYAPNITSDRTAGIGGWSDDELIAYLRTGHVAGKAQAAGPMAEAVENSLQHLNDADLKALVVYLRGTRPIAGETKPRYDFGKASVAELTLRGLPGEAPNENGFRVFSGTCAACHQLNGQGNSAYPSLFNNTATGAGNADNLIATVLFGVRRTVGDKTAFMPGFGPGAFYTDRLSDQDIADVSNYVLAHYGNPALKVTAADVAKAREGGEKPLLAKLAPYALPGAVAVVIVLLLFIGLLRLSRGARPAAPGAASPSSH
ncbi:cytochrome c [Azorhizobium oxalatiphilum]|uniref:Cytochrome c n=1 Tax=Azorhizobium oxalatiphilum TaxID=980631 RepID=A0A917BSM9_9HYPH|nr:cytochrome c [Azorhizobium oxalatiphilum]GGF57229.1 cytochrome c [Azorhizobium oxalatiphilum]